MLMQVPYYVMFLCVLVAGSVFKVRCLAEVEVAVDRLDVVGVELHVVLRQVAEVQLIPAPQIRNCVKGVRCTECVQVGLFEFSQLDVLECVIFEYYFFYM